MQWKTIKISPLFARSPSWGPSSSRKGPVQIPNPKILLSHPEAKKKRDQQSLPAGSILVDELSDRIFSDWLILSETSQPIKDCRSSLLSIVLLFKGLNCLRVVVFCNDDLTCLAELELNCLPKSAGLVVSESKVYAIGGDFVTNSGETITSVGDDVPKYPRDVYIHDFNSKEKKGNVNWEKGTRLIGGKPNPMVVAVNGKIYVIAGSCGNRRPSDGIEIIDPLFEVIDVKSGVCSRLPDPPFSNAYGWGYYPEFLFYVVDDNVLYVRVKVPAYKGDSHGVDHVFSFDLLLETWCDYYEHRHYHYYQVDACSCPLIVRNMFYFDWEYGGDLSKGKLYRLYTATRPAAFCVYNLCAVDDKMISESDKLSDGVELHDDKLNLSSTRNLNVNKKNKDDIVKNANEVEDMTRKEKMEDEIVQEVTAEEIVTQNVKMEEAAMREMEKQVEGEAGIEQVDGEVDEYNVNPAFKYEVDGCIPQLITGLEEIFKELPSNGITTWHLVPVDEESLVFCLVCFFESESNNSVLLAKFQLEKYGYSNRTGDKSIVTSSLHAQKVSYRTFPVDVGWGEPFSCFKI